MRSTDVTFDLAPEQLVVTLTLNELAGAIELAARVVSRHPPGSFWHRDEAVSFALSVTAPARCVLDGVPTSWDLEASVVPGSPFLAFVERVGELGVVSRREEIGANALDNCRNAAASAVRRCDPAARSCALAFAREARLFVYGCLLEDWWHRIRQAVEVCPGALVLGAAVPGSRDFLLPAIRGGARLPRIVADLLAGITTKNRSPVALVRHAPPDLPPEALLAVLREPAIDINDLPSEARDVVVWYAWCACAARAHRPLAAFVSKHAIELERLASLRGSNARELMAELTEWLEQTRSPPPSRTTAPSTVLAALDAWHLSSWIESHHDPSLVLPLAPTSTSCIDGVEARPLVTVGDLIAEGRRMQHCVATHVDAALEGRHAFFRARVHGEDVTIAVARARTGWYLVEAAGFANRPPSFPGSIGDWVETLADPLL